MEDVPTYRVIGSTGVHTATVFQGHTLVVAENEARVTLTTFHTHVLTARWSDHTQARLWTRTHTQRVGAVWRTGQGFMEKQNNRGREGSRVGRMD